ncbi:hypothetical protein GC088_09830 [Arthrobacter sp. JZ12]|uniref:discoidin domain-containing protein n=1 Tax=Arthrobacter sp. JZ12 TaxID=2654190 RepID=UPI002B4A2E04|nr:discoidin domain-containing protein [Arthrobacter sp. JZ12]WRH25332.1 hypothetical protein GC088_09830 [Arthrobacter sp. JZ12]
MRQFSIGGGGTDVAPERPSRASHRGRPRSSAKALLAGALTMIFGVGLLAPLPASAEETEQQALPAITETVSAEGFAHPGVGLTADHLQNAQAQVKAGVEPWASYYEAMAQTKYAARDYVAENQGPTDDQPKSDAYNQVSMRSMAHTDSLGALTQALMYVMTGDETYRANALHVIRTWSSLDPAKYQYFNDSHIHTGVPLYQFLTAAEILRATDPVNDSLDGYDLRWTERDQQRAEDNMVRPTIETFLFSQNRLWNQHLYGVIGMVAGAIFLDDPELYAERVEWFSVNATFEPTGTINGGDVNGGLASVIREIKANNPLNPYGHDFVQLVEMGRDQAHSEGDITTLTAIARMVNNQGTLLDPVHGTVSDAPDAVTPYAFLDNRLLEGADAFAQFMMGEEVPFIDVSGGSSKLSQAYRGRLRDMLSELYYQYSYVEGIDVATEAPFLAELHANSDGPLYYYGPKVENFWNPRGSDFTGAEYWAAFPAELAQQDVQVPPLADSAEVPVNRYGHVVGSDAKHMDSEEESFIRLQSKKDDATVAVRRMVWSDTKTTSLVGIRVRTKGHAVLQAKRTATSEPFAEISLPDTQGKWTYVWLDLDSRKIPSSQIGENILYLRAEGNTPQVDIAGVLSQANGILTPPVFAASPRLNLVAVAGEQLSHKISVTDPDSTPSLSLQGEPRGASINADGVLTWTPGAGAPAEDILVIATDGKSTTTLPVGITVAADRSGAIDTILADLQEPAHYTTSTWRPVEAARDAATAAIGTADTAGFYKLLEELRLAVESLEELNPRLSDGSLDFTRTATSPQITNSALATLTDGSNQTTWGDQRVLSAVLDFGPAYRVSADRFGFLARDTFTNRAEGTNVYGSNDNANWTLLTEQPNVGRDDEIEYINVREEVRDERFRFLKLQVDEPGVASDPLFPGIWTLSEFRIDGSRSEAVGIMDTVTVGSPDAVAGRVVAGDVVEVRFTGETGNTNVSTNILGKPATVTAEGPGSWVARRTLGEGEGVGSLVSFNINFTTPDGRTADPVSASTDGSSLYVSTDSGLVDSAFAEAKVTSPDLVSSSTHATDAAKLFDGNAASFTDTRLHSGAHALTWDFGHGGSVQLDAAEILVRQDGFGISRIKDLRLEGSNDGRTWSRLTPAPPKGTLAWQQWVIRDTAQYRYVRLINGDIMGVAELRLYGEHTPPTAPISGVAIKSSGPVSNYAVAGDTVTLDVTTREPLEGLTAVVNGVAAEPVEAVFTPVNGDPLRQQASVPVSEAQAGSDVTFQISYTGASGEPMSSTTNDSYVRLGTTQGHLGDVTAKAKMITLTGADDTSTVARPRNLFDNNLATATDARVVNGSADIIWDFGAAKVSVDRAELAVRQDNFGLTRISEMQLMGSNDLTTWTQVAGTPQKTLRWQDLPTGDGAGTQFRYLRLTNRTILNVAELKLYGTLQ